MKTTEKIAAKILKMPKSNGREKLSIPHAASLIERFGRRCFEAGQARYKGANFPRYESYEEYFKLNEEWE